MAGTYTTMRTVVIGEWRAELNISTTARAFAENVMIVIERIAD